MRWSLLESCCFSVLHWGVPDNGTGPKAAQLGKLRTVLFALDALDGSRSHLHLSTGLGAKANHPLILDSQRQNCSRSKFAALG